MFDSSCNFRAWKQTFTAVKLEIMAHRGQLYSTPVPDLLSRTLTKIGLGKLLHRGCTIGTSSFDLNFNLTFPLLSPSLRIAIPGNPVCPTIGNTFSLPKRAREKKKLRILAAVFKDAARDGQVLYSQMEVHLSISLRFFFLGTVSLLNFCYIITSWRCE